MRPLTSQFSASVARRDQVVIEDVRRRGAAHRRGDRVGVLEVGGERRDALVEVRRAAAQPGDLPAVGEQARATFPPLIPVTPTTSARRLRLAAHRRAGCVHAVAAEPLAAGSLLARRLPSAPRRPRTTQTARTVSVPSLLSRCGVDDGNVIESPALEHELVEADDDPERAAQDVAELVAVVADERVVGARRAARLVGRLDELDVLVAPRTSAAPSARRS